jgi:hypothetical protein
VARLSLVVSGSGWPGALRAVAVAGTFLGLLLALALLPGWLCSDSLTPAEAERSIRMHLRSQAALRFQERLSGARRSQRAALNAGFRRERLALREMDTVSLDVDTVLFGYTRIRRSFVVEWVTRGPDGTLSTRYYCFLSGHLTGECGRWNWWLAW